MHDGVDGEYSYTIDDAGNLPYSKTNPSETGEVCFGEVIEVDGLTSVKFEPAVLEFYEKTVCMQWPAVIAASVV